MEEGGTGPPKLTVVTGRENEHDGCQSAGGEAEIVVDEDSLPFTYFPLRRNVSARSRQERRGVRSAATAEGGFLPPAPDKCSVNDLSGSAQTGRPAGPFRSNTFGGQRTSPGSLLPSKDNDDTRSRYLSFSQKAASVLAGPRYRNQPEMHRDLSDAYLVQISESDETLSQPEVVKVIPPENEKAAVDETGNDQPATVPAVFMPKVFLKPHVEKQYLKRFSKTNRPLWTWIVTSANIALLAVLCSVNYSLTGSVIEKPAVNPMIGPTNMVLIRMGARFAPCMRPFAKYSSTARFLCASTAKKSCSLEEICSLGGFSGGTPNQWFRFIIPIFLHGGVVHLLLNLLFQVGAGRRIEEDMGSMRYFLLYMISGLVGNVLGANFAPTNQQSTGASGALFGLVGCLLLDLLHNWKLIENPRRELTKMLLMIAFSFAMGLLPGFDNFAHIGGFLGGFIGSFLLLPRINFGKWDRRLKFAAMLIAVPILVTLFALLLANFYGTIFPADSCRWCRYLSCLPVAGWCEAFDA